MFNSLIGQELVIERIMVPQRCPTPLGSVNMLVYIAKPTKIANQLTIQYRDYSGLAGLGHSNYKRL